MGTYVVVEALVAGQGLVGPGDGEVAVVAVPELRSGPQTLDSLAANLRWNPLFITMLPDSTLEVASELAAAVDLDGDQRVRQIRAHGLEEALGVGGGSAGVDPGHEVFTDGRDGLELFEIGAVAGQESWTPGVGQGL